MFTDERSEAVGLLEGGRGVQERGGTAREEICGGNDEVNERMKGRGKQCARRIEKVMYINGKKCMHGWAKFVS